MKKPEVKKKAAGPKGNGNITVDLGEAIDRKLRSVMGKNEPEKKGMGSSYRPGMFGWKPYGGDRPSRFGGSIGRWTLGDRGPLGLPREANTIGTLTGLGVGIIGNRALMRVSPSIVKSDNAIAHNAIAFAVGLIPLFVKQNAVTLGVALPGAVYLGGAIVDAGFDAVGISRPALRGAEGAGQGINRAIAARQRLQDIQSRMPAQQGAQRVYATR